MTQLFRLDASGSGISSAPIAFDDADKSGLGKPQAQNSFRHEAFFWRGEDEFLSGTVPFIREGLEAGQPVMVAVIAFRIELLRAALGTQADRVRFVDMAVLGRNPTRIIPTWREFVVAHDGQPVRGIGEQIWPGRRPAEVVECQLHEALLNVAIEAHTPLWLLCPYETGALAPDVITEAQRSHPFLVADHQCQSSILYGGSHHVAEIFERDLPASHVPGLYRTFGRKDLPAVREDVHEQAAGAGLSPARSDDLALAVHEVAANSLRHGAGKRVLRIWVEDDSLVCEVRDYGRITDPMIGSTMPAWDGEKGRGLWMASQLSDLVQVRSAPTGTSIRIHSWL